MTRIRTHLYRSALTLGFDLGSAREVRSVPRVLREKREFIARGGTVTDIWMFPGDAASASAQVDAHYFYQDLYVARKVLEADPERHIDFGSRVDGFIAHLAVFRAVEVLDLRDVPPVRDDRITFTQRDLFDAAWTGDADSVSCLHTLEHVGLGRYGDAIDPTGHIDAFRHLIPRCRVGGRLYVSFPVGRPQVVFNAHRVIDPTEVVDWDSDHRVRLIDFAYVDDDREFRQSARPEDAQGLEYGCGIYTFERVR